MEKLFKRIEVIKKNLLEERKRNIELFEAKQSEGYNQQLMKYVYKVWDLLDAEYEDLLSVADEAKQFKEENYWLPFLESSVVALAEKDFTDAYVDGIEFEFKWKEPDEETYKQEETRQIREAISIYMDIPAYRISCTSTELLLSGKIDKNTFIELNKGYC